MRHKLLKIWLVAFLAAVLMSEAVRAELSKSQQNSIKGSVVSIINRLGEDSIGSGIVVSYPKGSADCIYVLTNAHVAFAETEDGKSLEAKLDSLELYFHPKWFRNDEKITPRNIVKYSSDPNPDLALLEVEKKHFKQVPSAYTIKSDATLTAETEVTHFGFPDTRTIRGLGQGWGVAVSVSRIKSEQWIKQNVGDGSSFGVPSDKYFYTSPGIGGGGSGGAFFDSNGNWIGLHCIGFPTKNGILEKNFYNAIIKPNVIARFLGMEIKAPTPKVEDSMRKLIDALMKKDTKSFLSLISQSKGLKWINTIQKPFFTTIVRHSELAADFKSKEGWYSAIFDGDDMTACFRDNVADNHGKMWKKIGQDIFVPSPGDYLNKTNPLAGNVKSTYVKWQKEKDQWVLVEMVTPSA